MSCYTQKLRLLLPVEKPRLVCSRKLELLCAETQVTFFCGETPVFMQQETLYSCYGRKLNICGETPVAMQQETLSAMHGNSSYFYLWRNYSCYAAGNLSCYVQNLKLLPSVEKLRLLCSRKLELLCAETQVTFICGETPIVMEQET